MVAFNEIRNARREGQVQTVRAWLDSNEYTNDKGATLLHEICHIGFDLYGLGDDDEMPQMSNEFLTTVTSNMIQQLAGLNKELFQFIFEPPK